MPDRILVGAIYLRNGDVQFTRLFQGPRADCERLAAITALLANMKHAKLMILSPSDWEVVRKESLNAT